MVPFWDEVLVTWWGERKKERIKEGKTNTRADAAIAALDVFVALGERSFGLQCQCHVAAVAGAGI